MMKNETENKSSMINAARYNTGNRNSGSYNSGYRNSGSYNTGSYNSGDYNSGYYNSGNNNSGNFNSGDYNSGNFNSGMFNSCNYSNGLFNSQSTKIYMFNKPTNLTYEEFRKKYGKAYDLLYNCEICITEWITEEQMTQIEKEKNPHYKTTQRGYLKTNDYKEASKRWWEGLNEEEKGLIKELPNFDKDVFREITGIEIEN